MANETKEIAVGTVLARRVSGLWMDHWRFLRVASITSTGRLNCTGNIVLNADLTIRGEVGFRDGKVAHLITDEIVSQRHREVEEMRRVRREQGASDDR